MDAADAAILADRDRRSLAALRSHIAHAQAINTRERALTPGPWHGQTAAEDMPVHSTLLNTLDDYQPKGEQ